MALFKQELSTLLYLLFLFKDSELEFKLKLELKLELKSELKSKLPLLLVLGTIRAGTYQMSVDHKEDA